ncbi:MAG: hypothetical protein OHK0029_18210 [Armatimonadaceae bacterium]
MTTFDFHKQQVGTTELSIAARLDPDTENELSALFRKFFEVSEDERNWNLWNVIPWDQESSDPSPELRTGVMTAYKEHLFLPDYSAEALRYLRASRGRAWFLTRWSYDEGKHLLALGEWLIRSGTLTEEELKALGDGLLSQYQWEPPFTDATSLFLDALLWEEREIRQAEDLHQKAQQAGAVALESIMAHFLRDEQAHRDFFRGALQIIAMRNGEKVDEACIRVAEVQGISVAEARAALA